jgi:hypothetical protein
MDLKTGTITVSLDYTLQELHKNRVCKSHFKPSQANLLVPICSSGLRLNFSAEFASLISLRHGPHRKHSIYCWNVFSKPPHSNGCGMDSIESQSCDSHWCADCFLAMSYKHSSYCWVRLRDWSLFTGHCLEMLWPSMLQYLADTGCTANISDTLSPSSGWIDYPVTWGSLLYVLYNGFALKTIRISRMCAIQSTYI